MLAFDSKYRRASKRKMMVGKLWAKRNLQGNHIRFEFSKPRQSPNC